MENDNSSTNENITDYSTDHTEELFDYAMEYVGESADQEAESRTGSPAPVTANPAAENDDEYISLGKVIHYLTGVDFTLLEPPHAAGPPKADDLTSHPAVAPHMHVQLTGGNGGVAMPAGAGTLSAVPLAGGPIPVTGTQPTTGVIGGMMPDFTGSFSTLIPGGENGGTMPFAGETSSAVPHATVPNHGSSSAVPPAEEDGGKALDLMEIDEKPKNIHLEVLSDVPAASVMARVAAQPQVSPTLTLREYLISCNCNISQLREEERQRKIAGLRIFKQAVQIVHAAVAEEIVLTDMRPSRFIFVAPGARLKYTGALVLAESRSLANYIITRKRMMDIDEHRRNGGLKAQKACQEMESVLQNRHRELENAGYLSQFSITYGCNDDSRRYPEDPDFVRLEKEWYDCVDQRSGENLWSHNIYSLGVLLFELLCPFESPEKQASIMEDLKKLILPEKLLAEEPEAADFCLRILNPDTRPSTGEILEILAEYTLKEEDDDYDDDDSTDIDDDEVLAGLLRSLKLQKKTRMARILEELLSIDVDFAQLHASNTNQAHLSTEARIAVPSEARLELRRTWWNIFPNGIFSMSFEPNDKFIATAGFCKQIKVLQFDTLLDGSRDLPFTNLELSNEADITSVCWNPSMSNYLASADDDGVVKMWNVCTGQEVNRYNEHDQRAWQVDVSRVNPTSFASAGADGTVKLWSMNQLGSTATIKHKHDLCSVKYCSFFCNRMAIGSAAGKVFYYDIRHTRAPLCTYYASENPVTFVRFLDPETLVSSSTESHLKIWDLNESSQEACTLTLTGHRNNLDFLGLADYDGYIACGSETNEVFAYHRSLPRPVTTHAFGALEQYGDDADLSVESVCWGQKSGMLVAANSTGSIKILRLV